MIRDILDVLAGGLASGLKGKPKRRSMEELLREEDDGQPFGAPLVRTAPSKPSQAKPFQASPKARARVTGNGFAMPIHAQPQGAQGGAVRSPASNPSQNFQPEVIAGRSGLCVYNIGKRYGTRPVVRDISLEVQRGEAVGLLGPNGAGKTTSFYMITGLIKPDYGAIALDGHDITKLPMYRRARLGIGYLPQEASIFRGLTVEDNIMAVLEVTETRPEVRQAMLEELLAEFSISHLRHTPAIALSGGERRRAEIARALASRPSFMLLDEPLAGIDPIAVNDVREIVSHLKHRGLGVLITDHNVRETLDIIDRAYIIHEGTVLIEGSPQDIVNDADVRRVYLGERFSL